MLEICLLFWLAFILNYYLLITVRKMGNPILWVFTLISWYLLVFSFIRPNWPARMQRKFIKQALALLTNTLKWHKSIIDTFRFNKHSVFSHSCPVQSQYIFINEWLGDRSSYARKKCKRIQKLNELKITEKFPVLSNMLKRTRFSESLA